LFDFYGSDVLGTLKYDSVKNIEEKITCSTIIQEFGRKKEILGEGMASLKADSEQKAAAKAIENLRRKGISKPVPAIYSFFS
jgi:dsRNA-specific ribonuclease